MAASALSELDGKLIEGLDFCIKVYALFEEIRNSPDGPSRLRMRSTRLEKKLLEELLPICRYVQASVRPGRYISIQWVDGDQQFDAEMHQRGAYVSENYYPAKAFLEVTCVMHPKEHMSRELLEKKGGGFGLEGIRRLKGGELISEPVSYSNSEFIDSYTLLALKEIGKKAAKPYPANTTLVVQCTLNLPYTSNEWKVLVGKIEAGLPKNAFQEIYLYDTISMHSHTIWPRHPQHNV